MLYYNVTIFKYSRMRFPILLVFLMQPTLLFATPRVLTSIQPIYEITAAVMQGVAVPRLLIDAGASEHHFSFKPSHLRLIQQAQLIIWIDRNFESGLNRIPEILAQDHQHLELLRNLAIDSSDGHIWYSSRLLRRSIDRISQALIKLDPDNAGVYRNNAQMLDQAIQLWRQQLGERLAELRPLVVTDHDFLQHFSTDSGIAVLTSIYNRFDDQGGIKNLTRVEKLIRDNKPRCLLSLESNPSKLAQTLAQKFQLRIINVGKLSRNSTGLPPLLNRLETLVSSIIDCS